MKILGMNLSIALACFIVCGALFVMAVILLVGKYVNHDLDFFLTEVSENMEHRFQYMEDVVYAVRDSDEMMGFLEGVREDNPERQKYEMKKAADISNAVNQGSGNGPVVEKVYLFRPDGTFLSDFYYALVYSEITASDKMFSNIWKQSESGGDQVGFYGDYYLENDKVYMSYPVLDNNMQKKGTLIFEVQLDAVNEIMNETDNYEDSFWMLYDGETVIAGDNYKNVQEKLPEIRVKQQTEPNVFKVGKQPYRVFTRELCMQLKVTVGIPENQALFVLYDSLKIYIAGIVIILLVGLISFVIATYKLTKPIEEVMLKLRQVRQGNFETKLPDYEDKDFYQISQVFNQMTEYINHLVNQVYEKQISIKDMELRFLQSQMNPHFMFNVLNSIALQAKLDGNEQICDLISTFTRLIQAKIYRSDTETVQLCQELEYVKYYLEIQKFRYGDKLSYSICLEEQDLQDMPIPKLCIQLIAENAVVHGLEPKTGSGRVDISVRKTDGDVQIEVCDDGVGFGFDGEISFPIKSGMKDPEHNHVGLNNVNHIIQLMYGNAYGLRIYTKRGEGTRVSIQLPFGREIKEVPGM